MGKLAISGGTPLRTRPFTKWPAYDDRDRKALLDVLESRNWGGYPSPNARASGVRREVREAPRREIRNLRGQRHRHLGDRAPGGRRQGGR